MEMISIAVYASSFIKDLAEATSGKEPERPVARPGRDLARPRRPGMLALAAAATGALRAWLRPSRAGLAPSCRP